MFKIDASTGLTHSGDTTDVESETGSGDHVVEPPVTVDVKLSVGGKVRWHKAKHSRDLDYTLRVSGGGETYLWDSTAWWADSRTDPATYRWRVLTTAEQQALQRVVLSDMEVVRSATLACNGVFRLYLSI